MTDATATPPAPESPRPVSARLDDSDPPWPLRPWIMAAICAIAGLIFHFLVDRAYDSAGEPWRAALAALVAVSTLVFVLGVERRRWHWAAGFALLWGAVMGLISWHSAGYNVGGSPVEWPFWSGLLAVLVATPLFQTRRDVAPDWRFWRLWTMPYDRIHGHAWADAVIGAAGLVFTGITFLLMWLIASLFDLIGIDLIKQLMGKSWFGWMLAGAAFGGAVGLLLERDRLVATLQKLVMIVLAVLAPVLAVALVLFLISLLGTGLQKLWDSGFSTAALMLSAAAFAVLLANAVIGNGAADRSGNRLLHGAAAVLAVAVLPLAAIAFRAMLLRIGQYGWTPERIWGVIAVLIALAYGLAGVWALVKGRRGFDDMLRPLQQRLAIGLMLLAAFLALPILDFGAISTRDQMARLKSGAVTAEKFDWAAMAFDFGPSGREALKELAGSPDTARAQLANWALKAEQRWDLVRFEGEEATDIAFAAKPLLERVRVVPEGRDVPEPLLALIEREGDCRASRCVLLWVAADRAALIGRSHRQVTLFKGDPAAGSWARDDRGFRFGGAREGEEAPTSEELETGQVEVRPVTRQQIFVNGKPVGQDFE